MNELDKQFQAFKEKMLNTSIENVFDHAHKIHTMSNIQDLAQWCLPTDVAFIDLEEVYGISLDIGCEITEVEDLIMVIKTMVSNPLYRYGITIESYTVNYGIAHIKGYMVENKDTFHSPINGERKEFDFGYDIQNDTVIDTVNENEIDTYTRLLIAHYAFIKECE